MKIAENKVVAIDYTLKDDDGQVLDSSEGREPLSYLHGVGGIIPGLEKELDGKQTGDQLQVAVAPGDAYGERNEALRQNVSRDQFEGVDNLAPGMQFRVDVKGNPVVFTVVEVGNEIVTIDGNHPLAGVNLNFAVTVKDVREATPEEIAHGHAH